MTQENQRHLFEIPPEITYLNAAYLTPLARSVRDAGIRGVDRKSRPWEIAPSDFFTELPQLRQGVAQLLGGEAGSIAISPSTSYGTAIAAKNLELAAGSSILVLAEQYPSNYYIWRDKAAAAGGELVRVERPSGPSSWSEAVLEAIDESIGIVTLPQVHWSDGALLDLQAISDRCRSVGARLVLDLTQSLGVLPFSVREIDPDFVVAAAYKWLLGPYSLCFLYAAPRHHGGEPIEESWLSRKGSEDFSTLADYHDDLHEDARRFDVGESTNFALVPMAIEAIRLLTGWGVESVRGQIGELGAALREGASKLGISTLSADQSAPHIVGLKFPGPPPRDLVEKLAQKQIFVSLRGSTLRVSPHVYNDLADIERLLETLASR